jgi:hypothetical protein
VTTDHRPYWDALPADPISGVDPAVELARAGLARARSGAWGEALEQALYATARIAHLVRAFSAEGSLWNAARPLHASGFVVGDDALRSCGQCAWLFVAGPGRPAPRCRQTRRAGSEPGVRVQSSDRACVRFEARFGAEECGRCGACCRQGFDLVPVRVRDPIRRRHPELVHSDRHGLHVPRPDGRCLALDGAGDEIRPYRCRVYEDRPHACVEFEVTGDACLSARRRVALSR